MGRVINVTLFYAIVLDGSWIESFRFISEYSFCGGVNTSGEPL